MGILDEVNIKNTLNIEFGLAPAANNTPHTPRFLFLGVLLPLLLFCLATRNGLLLSPDSHWYSEIAANLAMGKGFTLNNGNYISTWAPLFPLLLSLGAKHILAWGWVLQLLMLLVSYGFWLRLGQNLQAPPFSYLYCFLLMTATPLLMVFVFLWSEGVFIMLLSVYICLLWKYLEEGGKQILLVAAGVGSLLFLQRNAGFFVLTGLYAGLLIVLWKSRPGHRLVLLVHGLLLFAGGLSWNFYRLFIRQELGAAQSITFPAFKPLAGASMLLTEYSLNFLPFDALGAGWLGAILVLVLLVAMGKWVWGKAVNPFYKVLYLGLMVYSLAWVIIPADADSIGRLLAPVLPIFFMLLVLWMKESKILFPLLRHPLGRGILLLWALYPFFRIVKNALQWGDYL